MSKRNHKQKISNNKHINNNNSEKTSIYHILIKILCFLFPIFSVIFFNFLKNNFFNGYSILLIEFIYLFFTLFNYYYIFNIEKCDKSNLHSKDNIINKSILLSLIIIIILKLILHFNPYKLSMSTMSINILIIVLLHLIFLGFYTSQHLLGHFYCEKDVGHTINIILFIINFILIYLNI